MWSVKDNAAKRRAQRRDPKRDANPRKVVEIGVYLTAGQLRRMESLMENMGVEFSILPEADPPYKTLAEWYDDLTRETDSLEQDGGTAVAAGGKA